MLKYLINFAIFATLAAESNQKFRIVNGVQIGRIVNETIENPGTFSYAVFLRTIKYFTEYDAQTHRLVSGIIQGRCGGSIIRSDIILTAAHCVTGAVPENVTAFAGIVHINMEQSSVQFRRGRRIVLHEHYEDEWKNDIALVFLVVKFDLSKYVSTISLGQPWHYKAGMNVTAVGWGRDVNGESTEWLFRGDFIIADRSICAQNVGYFDELLCALDPYFSQKVCSGDSGGPVVANNILVGISVGTYEPDDGTPTNGSCDPTLPAVFTNVSHYRSWIVRQIGYDDKFFRFVQ